MALYLTRIDRVKVAYTVTVTDEDGAPVTLTSLDVALDSKGGSPDGDTVWTTLPVTAGELEVVYTAVDATAEVGDIAVPAGGGDAYAKEVDGSFVKATLIDKIR